MKIAGKARAGMNTMEKRQPGAIGLPDVSPGRQGVIGVGLASAIVTVWGMLHIATIFFYPWTPAGFALVPFVVALQCWLYVGMFIIAHDCMHGSLVPFRPGLNRAIGQVCLGLYAGFSFEELNRQHHRHHRFAGTANDPDFDDHPPHGFWHWYVKFFAEYFSWPQIAVIAAILTVYVGFLGVSMTNALIFWALPALLSSLQLFTFGTYLPHRPGSLPFLDRHRSHSNNYPWLLSLLTCFHFGYHHAHHVRPDVPWWRLPSARRALPLAHRDHSDGEAVPTGT